MTDYRLFLCGGDGRIQAREEFVADDDAAAMRIAEQIFALRPQYPGFELWQRSRVVHRETRESLFADKIEGKAPRLVKPRASPNRSGEVAPRGEGAGADNDLRSRTFPDVQD